MSTQPGIGSARTTVRVHLKDNVDVDKIAAIVAAIGGRYGCRTCGLLGFDLQLAGDPGDFAPIEKLPGVASVEMA